MEQENVYTQLGMLYKYMKQWLQMRDIRDVLIWNFQTKTKDFDIE